MDKDFDGKQPSAYGLTKTIAEALASHPGVASATAHSHAARVIAACFDSYQAYPADRAFAHNQDRDTTRSLDALDRPGPIPLVSLFH